jgi:cold shock CspA family protein
MKGKITYFNFDKGFGFIRGEDRKKYFFHISKVLNPEDIEINRMVEFNVEENRKGLAAANIQVFTSLGCGKKDKILKIDDLRIRASDIKNYQIISMEGREEYYYNDMLDDITYYTYYALEITTYTSGIKTLEYDYGSGNKDNSYKAAKYWLEYIDEEMGKLI